MEETVVIEKAEHPLCFFFAYPLAGIHKYQAPAAGLEPARSQ
jgi:hypothetical protein